MEQTVRYADRMDRLPFTNKHRLVCFAIFISWMAECIDLGGTSFVLTAVREAWNMSPAVAGYYTSTCFLGMFFGAIVAGALADKFGRKWVIVVCMVGWGICGLIMASAQTLAVLLTSRFFLGLFLGAQFPINISLISETVPAKSRAFCLALYQLFLPIGIMIAGLLTMWILPDYGWRGVYYLEAAPAIFFIFVAIAVPESVLWLETHGKKEKAAQLCEAWENTARKSMGKDELPPVVPRGIAGLGHKATLKDLFTRKYARPIIACFFLYFFAMGADYGLTNWLTSLLVAKGFSVVKSIGFVTLGIAGGIPAFFVSAKIADKWGRRPAALFGGIVTCVFALIYGFSMTITTLIIFGILYQFGKYILTMVGAILLPEFWETEVRGIGSGLASSWGRLGSICGPIVFAWAFTAGTYVPFFIGAGCALLAGLGVFLLAPETKGTRF